MKNHGLLGQDHFLSGNDVLEYCLKNNIKLSSTSTTHSSPSEKQSYTGSNPEQSDSICDDQDEMETDDDDEEGSLDTFVRDDDSGDETPTGQTPTLPDSGKPLDREHTDDRNKEDSQDPYDWNISWKRVKESGREHRQAANILENWWYYKPVRSMRNLEEENDDDQNKSLPQHGPRAMQETPTKRNRDEPISQRVFVSNNSKEMSTLLRGHRQNPS